jgi:hypothetical protein
MNKPHERECAEYAFKECSWEWADIESDEVGGEEKKK